MLLIGLMVVYMGHKACTPISMEDSWCILCPVLRPVCQATKEARVAKWLDKSTHIV